MKMTDKTVLITGAGRGIGRDMAHRFAAAGARVVVADIDLARAETLATEIGRDSAAPVAADVGDERAVLRPDESEPRQAEALEQPRDGHRLLLFVTGGDDFAGPVRR